MGQAQLDPGPSWFLLAQFDSIVLTADFNHSSPSWPLARFDSWPILTLLFVSFLLFTVSSTLLGGKQQQPILTLGPFWPCYLFLSCCSLLVRLFQGGGGKQQQPFLTLGPFWPCHLFLSCCSLLVRLFQGVTNLDSADVEIGSKGAISPEWLGTKPGKRLSLDCLFF